MTAAFAGQNRQADHRAPSDFGRLAAPQPKYGQRNLAGVAEARSNGEAEIAVLVADEVWTQ